MSLLEGLLFFEGITTISLLAGALSKAFKSLMSTFFLKKTRNLSTFLYLTFKFIIFITAHNKTLKKYLTY